MIAPRAAALAALLLAAGCQREERRFADVAASARRPSPPPAATNRPGAGAGEEPAATGPPIAPRARLAPSNAYAIQQGQQLYQYFNCAGCHALAGGGSIGPPLMDGTWLYGGEPEDVYRSIVEGRPNGMPAFGGKIPEQQVWQLVAYVRALSGMVRLDARPGRGDALSTGAPPTLREPEPPHAPERRPGGELP